jgi:hypothetical protein
MPKPTMPATALITTSTEPAATELVHEPEL